MNPVAIAGGGITGLTAAYRLRSRNIPFVIYEASGRLGGMLGTVKRDGFLVEGGPSSILETFSEVTSLVRDLALEGRRWYPSDAAKRRYIVRDRVPVALPDSMLGAVQTPLFSLGGKLRVLGEPFISRCPEGREESLAEFVRRRLGNEVLDYAINPFVGGVYAGNPETLSVRQAFPKLYALERQYGSLIRGTILGARERKRRGEVSKASARMFSFDEGLQVLVDRLSLECGGSVRTLAPVASVQRNERDWTVGLNTGETANHSAVLLTAPAHQLAQFEMPVSLRRFWQVQYPPVARIALGFRRDQVTHPLDGFGVLVPQKEPYRILGVQFSSSIYPERAPDNYVLLTVYAGGARDPEFARQNRDSLVEGAVGDLQRLLGVTGLPVFQDVAIFPQAIPQYVVGYGAIREWINGLERKMPGVVFAGNFRDGISVADSIAAGSKAADTIITLLHNEQTRNSTHQPRVA